MSRAPLIGETEIALRVAEIARAIASRTPRIDLVVPILTGAFVFAADLVRALAREGMDVPVEFISLSRYGKARDGDPEIRVRMASSENIAGRHVLLVDGVLDHGHTLAKARAMLSESGAASIAIAVAVDKIRKSALLKANYAAFTGIDAFIVGYGMDDAGFGRGLPFIARV